MKDDSLVDRLRLRRLSGAGAQVGMISLPLPRRWADRLRVNHPASALVPVGWWERDKLARRAIAYVVDPRGVPEALGVKLGAVPGASDSVPANRPGRRSACPTRGPSAGDQTAWQVQSRVTVERRTFVSRIFKGIDGLRGQPAAECATFQGAVDLTFGGRTLTLQAGATGPQGGPYWWENVQVDRLWSNAVAKGVRLGGVVYNADTYLWADIYLVLFANGVADVAAHFVNTKLHIQGYDFQGLPVLRLAVAAVAGSSTLAATARRPPEGCGPSQPASQEVTVQLLPADGVSFTLGALQLNLADAARLCSAEQPGRVETRGGGEVWFQPFARVVSPHDPQGAPDFWRPGLARTVRFQFSLGPAPAAVARYAAPGWWYALAGEPWPGGYLPVEGRCRSLPQTLVDKTRAEMVRHRFDAPGGKIAHEGYAGSGLMVQYYLHGQAEVFTDALDYCYYWADIWVDHTDFTVWQGRVGWPWKTAAYTQFRDVLFGYLETGDPYLRDTAELVAESYWGWYRANWPRASIGRDNFELGAWALLARFLGTEHARDRTRELVRMTRVVLATRGDVGGQTGAGPHPGHRASLFLTGVTTIGFLEAAELALETGDDSLREAALAGVEGLHRHFMRPDIEMLPFVLAKDRPPPGASYVTSSRRLWRLMALRIYTELARHQGGAGAIARAGLSQALAEGQQDPGDWAAMSRLQTAYASAPRADALLVGARGDGAGLWLDPAGLLEFWPAEQTVDTPWGALRIQTEPAAPGTRLRFAAAERFLVRVRDGTTVLATDSQGSVVLVRRVSPDPAALETPPGAGSSEMRGRETGAQQPQSVRRGSPDPAVAPTEGLLIHNRPGDPRTTGRDRRS